MRKLLSSLLILQLSILSIDAQVVIDLENYNRNRNVSLMLSLHDSRTNDPVASATIYLIPKNDTTITNFAISDEKGEVVIPDIVPGWYQVNIEMIGYKAYRKDHNLKEFRNNLGSIGLEEALESIDAATVTALGNAVDVRGDTLTYNASSFSVGGNAMLEDLLRKMPGMEIAKDGTVRVNGEPVDRITIGGKTFFLSDPAMAVRNLPAKVVERIRIVDKGREDAEFSGVGTKGEKEKVMDLELKEQYRKGWFGNAKLGGGRTAQVKASEEMRPEDKALFNLSAMEAWYDEKDQFTFVANGKNASEPGNGSMVYYSGTDDIDAFSEREGLMTSAQAGANCNSERIGGMESSASVAYNYSRKDAEEMSARTSFQPDGTIIRNGRYSGSGSDDRVSASFYIRNIDTRKYLLSIKPVFYYTRKDRNESLGSQSVFEDTILNNGRSFSLSRTHVFNTRTDWNIGVKNLGKTKRSITFGGSFTFRDKDGLSTEYSEIVNASGSDLKALDYDTDTDYLATEGVFSYVEPFGNEWAIQTRFTACYISQKDARSALDAADGSVNDFYSAVSADKDVLFRERLLAQYEKAGSKAVLGLQIDQEKNEIVSRRFDIESTPRSGWAVNLAPYAEVEWTGKGSAFSMSAGGYSDTPMGTVIMPALNIADPSQITAGNVFLKTGFQRSVSASYRCSNPKIFSYFDMQVWGNLMQNSVVYASWFDGNGVRYAIPVNSRAPGYDALSYMLYRRPVSNDRKLTLTVQPTLRFTGNVSYQAKTRLPGLDKDSFDYGRTMSWFWGNADGDRFYSGSSGFAESRTTCLDGSIDIKLDYRARDVSLAVGTHSGSVISRYSIDKTADNTIWNGRMSAEVLWHGKKGWEARSDFSADFYKGYPEGYGKPECLWNMQISKTVGTATLRLSAADILNQERSLRHFTSAEYIQDTYHNVMGRYFLVTVSFNFGKMGARQNEKAQSAFMQMAY